MAVKGNGSSNITYLKINGGGVLYEKSSTPQEGFVEIKFQDKKTKEDKITYHNLFHGGTDKGYVSFLSIKDTPFGKNFNISIKSENGIDALQIPLFTQKGRLSPYAKNLACLLPNLDFSRKINIVPSTKKDQNGYTEKTMFINYQEGEKEFVKFAHKFGDKGDIPPAVKKKAIDGSEKFDFEEQDAFLYKVLEDQIKRFVEFNKSNSNPTSNTVATSTESQADKPVETTPFVSDQPADDLPF